MATATENKGRTVRQSNKPGKKAAAGNTAGEVPEALVYEMDNGVPIYYRGYKEVLAGTKHPEEIMGSSIIQSRVISHLLKFLFRHLPEEHYEVLSNELGLLFKKNSWRACDIAIFEQEKLKDVQFSNEYAKVPPKIVIEVDTKADIQSFESIEQYYHRKTDQLLQFGVERVVWIFTAEPRKIMIAAPNADWRITDWTSEIELLPGISFRLSDLVKK
jgi:Uma2 family endonuclease